MRNNKVLAVGFQRLDTVRGILSFDRLCSEDEE